LLNDDLRETREEVMLCIRALVDSVILTPAKVGRGVDIQITGKLARMIELATGQPLDDLGMITLERVKGIEPQAQPGRAKRHLKEEGSPVTATVERVKGIVSYHPWPRASV